MALVNATAVARFYPNSSKPQFMPIPLARRNTLKSKKAKFRGSKKPSRYPATLAEVDAEKAKQDEGFAGFRPLRIELEKLTQWWAQGQIDTDLHCFTGKVDPKKYHTARALANFRLEHFGQVMGAHPVNEVIVEVMKRRRRELGERTWVAFKAARKTWPLGNVVGQPVAPRAQSIYANSPGVPTELHEFTGVQAQQINEDARQAVQSGEGKWILPWKCNHEVLMQDGTPPIPPQCPICGKRRRKR